MSSTWIFESWGKVSALFVGVVFATLLQASSQPDEEIRLLIRCGEPGESEKPSFREWKLAQEESLLREQGKLYSFQFPAGSKWAEPTEYSFRNGVFLYSGSEFSEPTPESERKFRNYQFVLQYNPQGYEKWKDYSSPTTLQVWIVPDPIPNGFRRRGNTFFLSCPELNQVGDLSMKFRNSRLIRQNYRKIILENWLGDL